MKFEEKIKKLEEIVATLESENNDLEDSINKENTKEIANKIIEIAENSSISRVVFKDSSFNDGDSVKTNIKEIFSNNNIDEFIII